MTPAVGTLLTAARAVGATVVESPGATVIVIANQTVSDPEELLTLREAARVAATSTRVLRVAVRAGHLTAYGKQRDRAVRRSDLEQWVADRRVASVAGPADKDIESRVRRLARKKTV